VAEEDTTVRLSGRRLGMGVWRSPTRSGEGVTARVRSSESSQIAHAASTSRRSSSRWPTPAWATGTRRSAGSTRVPICENRFPVPLH
jgi:hypothetical protein